MIGSAAAWSTYCDQLGVPTRITHEEWKANVIRLAMYTAESGGYCSDGDREFLKQLIRDGVAYAKSQDMYVIIDWHILSDSDPNMHKDETDGAAIMSPASSVGVPLFSSGISSVFFSSFAVFPLRGQHARACMVSGLCKRGMLSPAS